MRSRFFYGWVIVLVAGLCCGFGMSPMYYSWGIFAEDFIADLGIDRGDIGLVFGLFNVLYQCVGVFTGLGPWLAGVAFDATAGYTIPFIGLMAVGFAGAASAAAMRHPGAPPAV